MKNIIHIIASPRGEASFSFNLGNEIIRKITVNSKEYTVIEKKLSPPFLSKTQIISFYKRPEDRSTKEREILKYSDEAIRELQQSDIIVISTPMYNMGIPASLKAWIDQIIRIHVTFSYDVNNKKIGLLKDKKMYVAIASGRVHSSPKYKTDFIADYFKTVLNPIGIADIEFYRIEGTAQKEVKNINYSTLISNL